MDRPDYRRIADEIARDIEQGRLRPGERLPPQRDFAYRRGIAPSTASRVYLALRRRGLVTGEVGRGTFVRSSPPGPSPALSEPAAAPVDLELNFPILDGQAAALAGSLAKVLSPQGLAAILPPTTVIPSRPAREMIAAFLARDGWKPDADRVFVAGSGKQAIAACLAALVPPGTRIGVEAMTYPVMLGIAERLGLEIVPIDIDDEGIIPEKLAAVHAATPLRAIYLQTHLHNPLGLSMGERRRAEIAAFLRDHDVPAIEDAIYSFLIDEPPLAALAPEQVIVVDSLSKRIAPGVGLGMIVAAPRYARQVERALRSGPWTANGLALAVALQMISDGTAERLQLAKREDAIKRQELARACLAGLELSGDPRAYHLLLNLPQGWRADEFVAAAAKRGVATVGARAFAVAPALAPNAIRIALASPPISDLETALVTLHNLATSIPTVRDLG